MAAYTQEWQGDAGCWREASVPFHVGLSVGLLEHPMAWWLAFPRASDPREQGGSLSVSYDLALEVPLCYIWSVLLITQVDSIQGGKRLSKGVTIGRPSRS